MSRTLFIYIARLYVLLSLGILAALTVVFLVVDFGDKLKIFTDRPALDVARLYGFKALVAFHQLAPAALLLAGGTTVSILRRRSEWIAMQAVGASRWVMVLPIGVSALLFAVGLIAFDEEVVTHAGTRVDRLMVDSFNRYGDFRFYYVPKQWFRVGQDVFQIRGETDEDGTLHDVSVFSMSPSFHLDSRIDIERMEHVEGSTWALHHAVTRRFLGDGESQLVVEPPMLRAFAGTSADTFRVRQGRPEQMRVRDILEQQQIRANVGLPTERFWLALHNRFAYPLTGMAASLLAVTLALRPNRRGHLTLAIVEGLVVSVALFALLLTGKALVLGEHVPASVAAWSPVLALLSASAVMWLAAERRLSFRRKA